MKYWEKIKAILLSKEEMEFFNSITWFLMDAFWMMEFNTLSTLMIIPTWISGIQIIKLEKSTLLRCLDGSMFCWMGMNALWLMSEIYKLPEVLQPAKAFFALGIFLLFWARLKGLPWKDVKSRFKKSRWFSWLQTENSGPRL